MTSRDLHVTLVVDPNFGQKAKDQAELGPIWLVRSAENFRAVQELWAADASRHGLNATVFDPTPGTSLEDVAIAYIGIVDLHHPNWQRFQVIGVQPSEKILDELHYDRKLGRVTDTVDGFIYHRS